MRTIAVIGKNFGDEGKGFACSRLASSLKNALIIKHNGGGQAGHTVEDSEGKWRFIHHQIGAGAEYHVPTLFADSFMPDLFQLGKEVKEFTELFGFQPILYSEKNARVTTIDDVLLNMGAEVARGKNRHGSCGMGIEECVQRNAAGYGITMEELATWSNQELLDRLEEDFQFSSSEQAWAALLLALKVKDVRKFLKHWKTSNEFQKRVNQLVAVYEIRQERSLSKRDCYQYDLDLILQAESLRQAAGLPVEFEAIEATHASLTIHDKHEIVVTGSHLIRDYGFKPGPELGQILTKIEWAVVDGELANSKEEIMNFMKEQVG